MFHEAIPFGINASLRNSYNTFFVWMIRPEAMSRAVHRLRVIGSPRGAAEKFDAKRVIGSVFF